jgi:hypothetical protein
VKEEKNGRKSQPKQHQRSQEYLQTSPDEREELLTNKNQVLARWKEHFEEHLNEGSE